MQHKIISKDLAKVVGADTDIAFADSLPEDDIAEDLREAAEVTYIHLSTGLIFS